MDLTAALHEHFGFAGFRPGQREACEAALAGRDVMVVMPTGSGKSLCYQLPALLRDDLTVVVSPLVALMQDQVEALRARGLGERVALVNAQQDASANAEVLGRAAGGELSLLYVAPERFAAPGFLDRMRSQVRVGLFVVDEAHCVSQWGHDFRPDYFRLADAARALDSAALVASTATATPRVAADVVRRLGLRDPLRVATGFDRPNISFAVARPGGHEKTRLVVEALRADDALPAIVYAGTRAGSAGAGRSALRGAGGGGRGLPRGVGSRPPRRRAAPLPRRRRAGDLRHQRLRHGRGQAQCTHRAPLERPLLARGLLPRGGPRGARRPAGAGAALGREPRPRARTSTSSSARRSTRSCRAGWRTGSCRPRTGTAATRSMRTRSRASCAATASGCER